MKMSIEKLFIKVKKMEEAVNSAFSKFESAVGARSYTFRNTSERVTGLSVKQRNLLDEALICLDNNALRAVHVMSWAALIDFVQDKIVDIGFNTINSLKPKWNYSSKNDFVKGTKESEHIWVANQLGLINGKQMRDLEVKLDRRNDCSHPTGYKCDFNRTLAYVNDIIDYFTSI